MLAIALRSPGRTRRTFRCHHVPALLLGLSMVLSLGGCENVSPGRLPALDDEAPLSREVDAALRGDPALALFFIHVKSLDGDTVRLSGVVDTESQRHAAGQVAAAVPGVRSVVNTLYLND